ncbi:MAG: DUF6020 family protein [Bacilli bacterium]|nr:DUF6020 family protein [Bacilli bacterium]
MKNKIKNILYAVLTSLVFLDYKEIYNNNFNIFKYNTVIFIIFIIILFIFYNKINNQKIHFLKKTLAFLFSIFMIFGYSYNNISSYNLIFGNIKMFLLSILSLIGYYLFFKRIFIIIDNYLNKENKINKNKKQNKIIKFIDEKPFISSLIIIIMFWLIYIIAFYPIILSPDPSYQIKQFFNVHTKYADWVNLLDENVFMTNHHPVIHTLLLGSCIKTGRFILNDNFGLFIYSFIQIIILASTLAYTIKYLKKINIKINIRIILVLIYGLVPSFAFYAMSGVKDTIYTSLIILYVLLLFDFINKKQLKLKDIIKTIILLLLIALFRNNGLYVILLSFPLLIIYDNKNIKKLIFIFIIFLSLFMTYSKVILPYFKIPEGSIREVLSIPFQQTARYVSLYEDELTDEDKKIIDNILIYDTLKTRYDPEFADPVKNQFNKNTTKKELKQYFEVWKKGLIKHPTVYIEATINNVYGYFYPLDTSWYIYYKFDSRITQDNLVDYHYNNLSFLRKILSNYGQIFPFIPIIGLISVIGFNTWLLLIMTIYYFSSNKRKYVIPLMPLLITLLICIASPVNTYFRYAMPYIFIMPLLIIIFIDIMKKNKN